MTTENDLIVPKMGTNSPKKGLPKYDPLVDKYPEQIHHRIAMGMGCGSFLPDGWYDLVCELDDTISNIYPLYIIDQVKEKFGGLRYYIAGIPAIIPKNQQDRINELIADAEEKSWDICDVCGEQSKAERSVIGGYLLATRCEKHDKEA